MINAPVKRGPDLPEFVALIALITSLVALSIDAVLPALPDIARDLSVSDYRQTQWVITSLVLGMSGGQLFFGPLSDAFGRKFTISFGVLLFSVGSLLSMFAQSMTILIVGRILQGIGVSGPRIGSMALIRDQYVGDQMARVMSFVMTVFIVVPMLAPVIGQWILYAFNWRMIFGFVMSLAIFSVVWLNIRQPETLAKSSRRPFTMSSILHTAVQVVKHPRVLGFAVTSGFIFGSLLSYVSSAQTIFQDIYQVGSAFPYYFAALAFGIGLASLANSKLVVHFGALRLTIVGLIGVSILSLILLFMAILNEGSPILPVFMVFGFILFFFIGILFGNLNALAMVPLGRMAGIGAAVIGSISNIVAVLVAAMVGWLFNGTLVPMISGWCLCSTVSLLIVHYVKNKGDASLA